MNHLAIDGDFLTGSHHEDVADLDVVDRDLPLAAVPDHTGGLGSQIDQFFDGGTRLPAASGLEVAAEQDQGGDDGAGFKVEVRFARQ